MPSRREEIVDAAIQVLGAEGPRGLTHRAVDRELDLPLGSTANVYGRRSELLGAIVTRMEEMDRAQWENVRQGQLPSTPEELAVMLTGLVLRAGEAPMQRLQKARYYLQFGMPQETGRTNAELGQELADVLEAAGCDRDQAGVLLPVLDGLMLRAVTYGTEALPPAERIAASLQRLMR